jgi:methyl-accepting chemotaxis protein
LEETSSVTEELALDNRYHNDFLQELKKVTDNAETVRKDTLKNINDAVTAMSEIEKSSIETSDTVKIIEGISFQTNLLALNASVEAARAGEVGAGFAVVAEEVRNLAIHSAEAASNTSNLIKKMVQAVADGGKLVSSCTTEFGNYSVAADRYVEVINKASEASREQDQGFEQINFAIREISKVDQKNAAGAEEVAEAAKEMHHQTQVMNRCISQLLELLYGSGANRETASKIQEVLKAVSKPSMGSNINTGQGGQRERPVNGGINV